MQKVLNKKILLSICLLILFILISGGIRERSDSILGEVFLLLPKANIFLKPDSEKQASPSAIPKEVKKEPPKISIPAQYGRSVRVPILIYHYIGNNPNPADKTRDNLSVTPDLFENQMQHLSTHGYTPITLDTLYAGLMGNVSLPGKPIVLTFDDGYIDFYVNAFPILRRFNFQAVSFIPTGLMDQSYYLHWDQIKEMDSTGLISFQAHTVNHVNLTSMNDEQLKHQLSQSKQTLETNLGKPVNFMAYPYGTSDERVWAATKKVGYLGSFGTWYGVTESEGTIFDMPRIKVAGTLTMDQFASMFP